MKGFLFCMFLVFGALLAGPVLEASAQFPMPAAKSPTMTATAPVVAAPQMVPVPAAAPGWSFDNIMSLLNTGIAGLIAALLAKLGFMPATTRVAPAATSTEPTTATGLLKSISDPALRAKADEAILTVLRSGIPGAGVQAGLSMVPGIGPLLTQAEPLMRDAVDRLVSARLAQNSAPAAP